MASPRGFGSASAVVLWAALEAGRRVSGGLHGGVGSAPAAPLVRPVLGSQGDKVTPAGRASCREGCRHGPESSGGFLSRWGLVTEITNDVGCAFISVVWRLCLRGSIDSVCETAPSLPPQGGPGGLQG